MRITLFLVILVGVFVSCSECDDCEVFIGEPQVTLVFLNQDSLSLIQSDFNENIALIDSLSSSVVEIELSQSILSDSIFRVESEILQGNEELQSLLEQLKDDFSTDSLSLIEFNNSIQQLDSVNSALQAISSTINSGLLLVEEVRNTASGNSIVREDSVSEYSIPLDFNNATTSLQFVIQDDIYELNLSHENEFSVDERTRVNVRMTEIEVISHTFQSVSVQCNTNSCSSNETLIICSF